MRKKKLTGLFLLASLAVAAYQAYEQGLPVVSDRNPATAAPAQAPAPAPQGNLRIRDFEEAKRIARKLHGRRGLTLYCRCRWSDRVIDGKSCGYEPATLPAKSRQLQWEHVVPAHAFGQSFPEWRDGSPECRKRNGKTFNGRDCARKNPLYARMEADLYNLFPEVGEVNELRKNYSMAELGALGRFGGISFGGCQAKVYDQKFEPMDFAKGTVARIYLYMDQAYPGHGIVSRKNEKLFEAWDRQYPVEKWECDLYREIRRIQGNENPILASRCGTKGES